jgi:anti-sigma factor RsiW
MMTCKEVAELLMDYCAGELSAECCELICQHLHQCAHCHHFTESYRITVRICRDLPAAPMPEHLLAKVRAALKELGEGPCV